MFTGIVEEIGTIDHLEPRGSLVRLVGRANVVLSDAQVGDSLCHNGCCLTITELTAPRYACDVMAETLRVTALGDLKPGSRVNLERALAVGGRFGGHVVQGHVDGVGSVQNIARSANEVVFTISMPASVQPYVVAKGSICANGLSLTVVDVGPDWFTVSLIPHTLAVTTMGELKSGDRINLEADILAKYVVSAVQRFGSGGGAPSQAQQGTPAQGVKLTSEWLLENGF